MLQILNTQSRRKEEFKPLDPAGRIVTMYTCGLTVYDSLHLGHARYAITSDIVRRYFEYRGYEVHYVTNFTDIDDKIIKRAIAEKRDWREITATYIDEFHRLMSALNVKPADVYPRATHHIPEMREIVKRLLDRRHAYIANDGDVYFDIASFPRYGALSGRKLDEEEVGISGRISQERLKVKRNSGDFVLWKLNRNDTGELAAGSEIVPHWPSPWGDGRPGWHLECSAMSQKYVGVPFDIHCGGQDLLFPHHEDEKAQTECAYSELLGECEAVRYWIHNAFVNVKARPNDQDQNISSELIDSQTGGLKMSKSLGNVKWLREIIWPEGPCDPMAVRMMLLGSHYRSPIIFEPAMLDEAVAKLDRIYNTLEALERALQHPKRTAATVSMPGLSFWMEVCNDFEAAMDDDFNTAGALGALFELITRVNKALTVEGAKNPAMLTSARYALQLMLNVLGIRPQRAKGGSEDSAKLAELLLQIRQDARIAKQFAISDKIRAGLNDLGYEIEDLSDGKWVVKKKSCAINHR
ncbi:MAG: cysteine--tRNA ligase [Planctomycetota bacterium]